MADLNQWASTLPDTRPTMPNPGDACGAPDCDEILVADQEVYAVTEIKTAAPAGSVQRGEWVCWRHIVHEDGRRYPVEVTGG